MNNFKIKHSDIETTIHTIIRNNKELAKIIGKINGVRSAYSVIDYEISANIAECFDKEAVIQLIKKEVNLYYKKKGF